MPLAFASLLVPLTRARVLAVDDDVVAVDKPAGLSTHAPEAGDDLASRVRFALGAADAYLGPTFTLDRDASGVVLFTRRKSANAPVARQLEGGTVRFDLVAAVAPWPARAATSGTLRARVKSERGGVRAVPKHDASGREAVARYTVLAHHGERALVRFELERGPLGQLPAQLEALGCAIAGDRTRGGARAPRRMLHLERVVLRHPTLARDTDFHAPAPDEFLAWVRGAEQDTRMFDDDAALDRALAEAASQRHTIARRGDTDAFRVVNDAGDGVPGITVDVYGEYALVQFYTPAATAARERVLDAVGRAGARGVYAKFRPKQANTLVDTRRDDLAPARALRGEGAPEEFVVRENGLAYRVRLGDGLSTGIFLDQRENRARVREWSAGGASVLNLFAYTGPFTVAAAAGGAKRTLSVDASSGALAWATRNLRENGFDGTEHGMAAADVFGWLEGAHARRDRYDLIVLDPPSYSTTREGSRFSAESDYRALATSVLGLLAAGGRLLACSNHRGISAGKFHRQITEAARAAGLANASVTDLATPADFPPAPGHDSHLKSVVVRAAQSAGPARAGGATVRQP